MKPIATPAYQPRCNGSSDFARIIQTQIHSERYSAQLSAAWFDTKLGPMIAIADTTSLYLLDFFDGRKLAKNSADLQRITRAQIIPNICTPITQIAQELAAYFAGTLTTFATPITFTGTNFQKHAWHALLQVPYNTTRSYKEQSMAACKESAHRAIANANGVNKLAIIVPCHRIVRTGGALGGYGGGLKRKRWLLDHENGGC